MIAIGIDPSMKTGIVVLGSELGISQARCIKTEPVATWQEQALREAHIVGEIEGILATYLPQVVFLEDYAIGGGFANTIIPQVQLGGQLRSLLRHYNTFLVAPTTLKKWVTGSGRANKVEVAVALNKRFGVEFGGNDDIADAYGLARMALASMGHTEGLTKEQIAVVEKVIAPKAAKAKRGAK